MRDRANYTEGADVNRRLFTILSAVLLVLCIATAALWARSYWVAEQIGYTRPFHGRQQEEICIGVDCGLLHINRSLVTVATGFTTRRRVGMRTPHGLTGPWGSRHCSSRLVRFASSHLFLQR
jgi:hypothetical protein